MEKSSGRAVRTSRKTSYICSMSSPEKALQKASNGKAQALREAAKQLAGLGYLVIQTGKDGDPKRPLKKAWNREPAPSQAEIEAWGWPDASSAGIAVVPDGSVIGIDLDAPKSGGQEKEAEVIFLDLLDQFPVLKEAWVERTPSGGYHIIARVAPDVDLNKIRKSVKLANGVIVEVKSHRKAALVVAPTEMDGKPYEVVREPKAIDSLPELQNDFFAYTGLGENREKAQKTPKPKNISLDSVPKWLIKKAFELIEKAEVGNRNNSTFKAFLLLGKLKTHLSESFDSIHDELLLRAKERLVAPDFTEAELRRAAGSGLERAQDLQLHFDDIKISLHPDFVANIVSTELEDNVIYIEGNGWRVWNGRFWQLVPKEIGILGEIKKVISSKLSEWERMIYKGEGSLADLEIIRKLEKLVSDPTWLGKVEKNLQIEYKYRMRKSPNELPKPHQYAHLLCVLNGVIDLRTAELYPHENFKHLYLPYGLDIAYDPNADAPAFKAALQIWSAGDPEWIDYMQWVLGSALTGDTSAQKMYIFYGKTSNGKSTLLRAIAEVLQDFAVIVPNDLFKANKRDNHPTSIMTLYGKRMAILPDFAERQALDEEIVKMQTGDLMTGRRMREDYVVFEPTHKTFLATNGLPKITSSKEAVLRRIVPIPFRVTFEGTSLLDKKFINKLRAEKEGILCWLVEGAKMYYQDPDRKPPKSIGDLWEWYKRREDPVTSFIHVCLEKKEGETLSRKEVYDTFQAFCQFFDLNPLSQQVFTRRFREIVEREIGKVEEKVVQGERLYKGIKVKENWQEHEEPDFVKPIPADALFKTKNEDTDPDPEPDGGGDGGSGGSGQSPQEAPNSEAPSSGKDFDTEYLDNPSSLSKLKDLVKGAEVGFDLETTGLNPAHDKVRLLSIYQPNQNKAYVLDLFRIDRKAAWEVLMEAGLLVGHNIAFDLSFIMRDGIYIDNPKSRLWDTMLAEKILDYNKTEKKEWDNYSLEQLATKVGIQLDKTLQKSDWTGLLTEDQIKYAAWDAYAAYEIHKRQKTKLDNGLKRVFAIEMGALPAVTMLRAFGVGVNKERLTSIYEDVSKKTKETLDELDKTYREELQKAGINDLSLLRGVNWRSPEQIKEALGRLALNVEDLGSTGKDVLIKHKDHPVVAKLLEFRAYDKQRQLVKQWIKAFKSDSRIYANWKQIGADTGRMSCKDPNLQQVPSKLRECIVPQAGNVLVKADFSQIELRIAAVVANDQRMLKAFEEGIDLHKLTASLVRNKPVDEVTKEERQMAKALNFGLIYGMQAESLKDYAFTNYGVKLSLDEAREYRKRFFDTYVGLATWHQKVERELRQHKSLVVTTLGGRKRLVNEVTAALNTPVQGTGADGLKAAAALYYKRLMEHGLIDKVRIVLMVHDEIVVEAPERLALKAAHLLTEAMVEGMQAIVKGVPIEVEAGIYADWGKTTHKIQEAWEVFCKLPKDSVVRDAILNDYEPDPRQAREDMSRYFHIKTILSGDDLIPF